MARKTEVRKYLILNLVQARDETLVSFVLGDLGGVFNPLQEAKVQGFGKRLRTL